MKYRVVSKRRSILTWVLVALGCFVSMFVWRAGKQDLSFLRLPYFFIAYAAAVLIVGISYGLIVRLFLQAAINAINNANGVGNQSWLLSSFILVALTVTSFGLILLTQVQLDGGVFQYLTCVILAGGGLWGTLKTHRD